MRYPSITLTLAVLGSLFDNGVLCTEFPFVGFAKKTWDNAAGVPMRTGCCGGRGSSASRDYKKQLLETVKASLIGLPPERIKRFKDLLGTDKLVLHFSVRGQTVAKEL